MSKPLKLDRHGALKLSEADVTEQCITWLRLKGWTCLRQHRGKFVGYSEALHRKPHNWNVIEMGEDGDPDWLCFRVDCTVPPSISPTQLCRMFYLELKEPGGGRLRPTQWAKITVLRESGYRVCVADSLEVLQEWIEEVAGG